MVLNPQQIGRLRVSKVIESPVPLPGLPLPMLFPDITPDDLRRLAQWCPMPDMTGEPETSVISLGVHSFVMELDGQNILVDACNGNHKTRALPMVHDLDTPYLENLAAAGFRPEDIHLVLCTHLHADHVGWNTRLENGRWVPTFPNARYIFSKRDYEHWSVEEGEAELLHRQAFDDSVLPVVQAGRAEIVDADDPVAVHREIGDGVWMEPAYGHSPGCVTVHAEAGGAPAIFWGDVVHHPLQLVRPDLPVPFDHDRQAAVAARLAMLDRVADGGTVCFPAHFGGPTAGKVLRDGQAFKFLFAA